MPYNLRFVSTYPPRRCGIGEYTKNLATSCKRIYRQDDEPLFGDISIAAICPPGGESVTYGLGVDIKIAQNRNASWKKATDQIVKKAVENNETIVLQHEFGITKNEEEDQFVYLARKAKEKGVTVITYLHTTPEDPEEYYLNNIKDLGKYSDVLVVHTEIAKERLQKNPYNIDPLKIEQIHHGVRMYEASEIDRLRIKKEWGAEGILVPTSFGMRGPGKGLKYSIQAYARFLDALTEAQRNDITYLIAGACHPDFKADKGGETYRLYEEELMQTITDTRVRWPGRYVQQIEGNDFVNNDIIVADVYLDDRQFLEGYGGTNGVLLFYPNVNQASSGILTDVFGTGRPAVTTKFAHARELLFGRKDVPKGVVGLDQFSRGIMVDAGEESIEQGARALDWLMIDGEKQGKESRLSMEMRAHRLGHSMSWDSSAESLGEVIDFIKVRETIKTGRGARLKREIPSPFVN
jgi:hypothetical protein